MEKYKYVPPADQAKTEKKPKPVRGAGAKKNNGRGKWQSSTSSSSSTTAEAASAGQAPARRHAPASAAITAAEREGREVIRFFGQGHEIYKCFSNFSPYPIKLKGTVWPTTEHYFQAMKFEGTEMEEYVRITVKPSDAKKLGRSQTMRRKDWSEIKDDVMRECLMAKFTQHKDIRDVLLGTGDALILEHTDRDTYWGDGGNGSGFNMLGVLLMEVREELRQQQPS